MIILKCEELDKRVKNLIKTCLDDFPKEKSVDVLTHVVYELKKFDDNQRLDIYIEKIIEDYKKEYKNNKHEERSIPKGYLNY